MDSSEKSNKKVLVYELISDKLYRPMKFKEMAGLLQVPKEDRNDLRLILENLISEGKVDLDSQDRYTMANTNIKEGVFSGTSKGFGFVIVEGEENDIFISESDLKGARDKDRVQVSLKEEKRVPNGKRREGIVTKIIERGQDEIVGTFKSSKNFGFVLPDNQKFGSDIFISREHTKGAVEGHKVVVKITNYGSEDKNPEGRVVEILGHISDPGVDIMSVIRSNGLPTKFPDEVLRLVNDAPSEIAKEEAANRLDLRDELTVTIDGEDAKDLDDAVTIQKNGDRYSLGVHIADVTNYVKEGSALDIEAQKRGTSVYLVDRVIPMLPHQLSNGICSLNAGTDRLALSCMMEIDNKGNIISHKIAETIIRVDRRMTYTKVNELITAAASGETSEEEIKEYGTKYIEQFVLMQELSTILREKRKKRGSLDFDLPESKIILDEAGHPLRIQAYERNRATKLIEDFMLAANETVAEEYFWLELPFVYRSHEIPDADKIKKLSIFINNFGYSIHQGIEDIHPKELQKLLTKIEDTPEEALISRLTLRSMKRAQYTTTCDGHFGLAAKYYCHFTSPIRRYPDLQIHRIIKENLKGALKGKRVVHYTSILSEVALHSSHMERRADEAERDVEKMKKAEFMKQFIGETYEGVISGVTAWGMYVELPNTVEGMIRVSDMTDDFYVYDEAHYMMIGDHTKKKYKLGQKITVLVAAVDLVLHTIDFALVK